MDIRKRLTFQFITIVALIISLVSVAIYFFSEDYRQNSFYERLRNKAENVAKLLIEVEEIDAELLRRLETDNPLRLPEEQIIIYNFRNEALYHSNDEGTIPVSDELLDEIRLEGEVRFNAGQQEILGFLYAGKFDRFVVVAGAVDIYGHRKMKNLTTILWIVFGASILVVFFAGRIYSGRALRPIARIIDQVNDISGNNLNSRLEERTEKDEITQLTHTFNKMLDRLEIAFNIQKNFIANASHELRTPLTAITGQMEVTLLKERTNDEYKQTIASVLEDMKSLNNLANRLLLLAQASAESSLLDKKTVRIDDVIWQVRSEILRRHPEYTINVQFDDSIDDEEKLVIPGNEQLIKIAVQNLIDNACKYSGNHSVEVRIKCEEKIIILQFIDQGIGIPADEIKQVFEPFYRGKNAFATTGHGIGLSLVQRIVTSHGGMIEVRSKLDAGTAITLRLPVNF